MHAGETTPPFVRDDSVPRADLLWAAAALLLQVIADGDSDASALGTEVASLLGEASGPPAGEPAGPGEPLTESEARVLRYLPTYMGVPQIAAELHLSANTVRTHLRHLYWKLGAHSRREAVQRARALGMLAVKLPDQRQGALGREPPSVRNYGKARRKSMDRRGTTHSWG